MKTPRHYLILADIEHRRVGQIDETALVFEQLPAGCSTCWRTRSLDEVLDAVPIDFGDTVKCRQPAAAGLDRRIGAWVGERMTLGVAADPQGLRVRTHEWSMAF